MKVNWKLQQNPYKSDVMKEIYWHSSFYSQILCSVHGLYAAGVFQVSVFFIFICLRVKVSQNDSNFIYFCKQNGQVASNTDADVKTIRGDKITWVKGTESHCQSIGFLINQVSKIW